MQETAYASPPGGVAVTRPVAVRQVAAGLATAAAAIAASGLALSADHGRAGDVTRNSYSVDPAGLGRAGGRAGQQGLD